VTDTTNDIDALLRMLNQDGWEHHHAALTALVAERDRLKAQCDKRFDFETFANLVAERDELKQRVAELEAHPPADRDRDLRERLVCAIWPELLRIFEKTDTTGANWDLVRINARAQALRDADEMIAAMRKGEA
jgi:hypothetical protein